MKIFNWNCQRQKSGGGLPQVLALQFRGTGSQIKIWKHNIDLNGRTQYPVENFNAVHAD